MRVPRNDSVESLRQVGVWRSRDVAGGGGARLHAGVQNLHRGRDRLTHAFVIPDLIRDLSGHERCALKGGRQRPRMVGSRIKSGMTVWGAARSRSAAPFSFRCARSSAEKRRQADHRPKIVPERIVTFDQLNLPVSTPALEAFLGCDRVGHGVGRLVPDESLDAVTVGEATERAVAMLHDTTKQVGRDAQVQRAKIAAGHHIDARLLVPRPSVCAERWTPAQGRGDEPREARA